MAEWQNGRLQPHHTLISQLKALRDTLKSQQDLLKRKKDQHDASSEMDRDVPETNGVVSDTVSDS
jgi:hypothetical protein